MHSNKIGHVAMVAGVSALAMGVSNAASASATAVSALKAGDLVISEIMIQPNGDETKSEWFELYNASGLSVDLNGLVINGRTGETQTVSSSVVVAAGGYALFAANATAAKNGGLPTPNYTYVRANTNFYNTPDTLSIAYGTLTFDSISWTKAGTGTFSPTLGFSLQLDVNHLNADHNANAAYWCLGATAYGTGGFGTPGSANSACSGISTLTMAEVGVGDLVVTEIQVSPYAANDAYGEWIEVYNAAGEDINLNGLVLGDDATDAYTISTDVIAYDGGVVLLACNGTYTRNGGLPTPDAVYTRSMFKLFSPKDQVKLSYAGTTIDEVTWKTGSPTITVGSTLSLDPTKWDSVSNDTIANWCNGVSSYGTTLNFGTPKASNDSCF